MSETQVITALSLSFLDGAADIPRRIVTDDTIVLRRRDQRLSDSEDDALDSIELPRHKDSVFAIRWCGFAEPIARELSQRWSEIQNDPAIRDEIMLSEVLTSHITKQTCNAYWNDTPQTWEHVLRELGMASQVRERLSSDAEARKYQSAMQWALEIVKSRLEYLKVADEIVQLKQQIEERTSLPADEQHTHRKFESKPEEAPLPLVSFTERAPLKAGEKVLYKGCEMWRLYGSLRNVNKSLKMGSLVSDPPTDFEATSTAFYLTSQWETAEYYARLKHRHVGPEIDVGIMTIHIPLDIMDHSPYKIEGLDCQRLVWSCRSLQEEDAHYAKYQRYKLLIGPICHLSTDRLQQVDGPSDVVFKRLTSGEYAHQYVFRAPLIATIGKRRYNKVYIDILPAQNGSKLNR